MYLNMYSLVQVHQALIKLLIEKKKLQMRTTDTDLQCSKLQSLSARYKAVVSVTDVTKA